MTTWVIAASTDQIGEIVAAAGAEAKILVCGSSELAENFAQAPVSEVFHIDTTAHPAEAFAPAIAQYLKEAGADTILCANFPAERALSTAAAAKIGATWVSGAVSWDASSREVVQNVAAMALETIAVAGPVALTLPAAGELTGGNPHFSKLELTPLANVQILSEHFSTGNSADLSKSARVIGVGRGISEESDLEMIRQLAESIDAQVGGTRPLAEGYGWFDTYIGLTGQPVAAELYLAIGTSGQIHHAGGVRESSIIAAICDDPQAPIFHEADYGIVGDLYEIVPQIQAAL